MASRQLKLGAFRTWYYLAKMGAPIMVASCVFGTLAALLPDAPVLSIVAGLTMMFVIHMGFHGATLFLLNLFGEVRMRCPYCDAYGAIGADEETGIWMACDQCGFIHGSGWPGWTLVKEPIPSSVTWSWELDPSVPLVLDLDDHQLSGVGVGDALESLAFLGPAQNHPSLSGYVFPSQGIVVEEDDVGIHSIAVYLRSDPEAQIAAFRGTFCYRGQTLLTQALAREEDVLRNFGTPYWRDQDEEEVILFYEFANVEWQVEFALSGETRVFVVSVPVLSDPEQRRLYRVTRVWPPEKAAAAVEK